MKIRLDDIEAAIINNKENIDWDLIDKSSKKIYRQILRKDDNVNEDLHNNVMGKSIYIFSQIKYIKTKTYKS